MRPVQHDSGKILIRPLVAERLRHHTSLPVSIMVSAASCERVVLDGNTCSIPGSYVLQKPFDTNQLPQKLEECENA